NHQNSSRLFSDPYSQMADLPPPGHLPPRYPLHYRASYRCWYSPPVKAQHCTSSGCSLKLKPLSLHLAPTVPEHLLLRALRTQRLPQPLELSKNPPGTTIPQETDDAKTHKPTKDSSHVLFR
ncbi:hypothetical protein P7K49_026041, partial [Saguinus oedipus]